MALAEASSGRSFLATSSDTHVLAPGTASGETAEISAVPPLVGALSKTVGRTVITLTASDDFDDSERVARADRPHEGGIVPHLEHVRNLRHVEKRRHARQQPLAEGGGIRHHMSEATGLVERQDDGRARAHEARITARLYGRRPAGSAQELVGGGGCASRRLGCELIRDNATLYRPVRRT